MKLIVKKLDVINFTNPQNPKGQIRKQLLNFKTFTIKYVMNPFSTCKCLLRQFINIILYPILLLKNTQETVFDMGLYSLFLELGKQFQKFQISKIETLKLDEL